MEGTDPGYWRLNYGYRSMSYTIWIGSTLLSFISSRHKYWLDTVAICNLPSSSPHQRIATPDIGWHTYCQQWQVRCCPFPQQGYAIRRQSDKREKRKELRYRLHKSFICNKLDKVLLQITIMQEVSLKRVEWRMAVTELDPAYYHVVLVSCKPWSGS